MKKFLALLLALVMTLALAACGGSGNTPANNGGNSGNASDAGGNSGGEDTTEPAGEQVGAGKVIGIAMPTQSSERWINDGANMKAQLEALGYEVQLQYAEDDPQTQVSQVEGFVAQQVDCLVIAAIDGGPLVPVEEQAKAAGIPVIAYDRLLKDTDAVKYYASFVPLSVSTSRTPRTWKPPALPARATPLSSLWVPPTTTTPSCSTRASWACWRST